MGHLARTTDFTFFTYKLNYLIKYYPVIKHVQGEIWLEQGWNYGFLGKFHWANVYSPTEMLFSNGRERVTWRISKLSNSLGQIKLTA